MCQKSSYCSCLIIARGGVPGARRSLFTAVGKKLCFSLLVKSRMALSLPEGRLVNRECPGWVPSFRVFVVPSEEMVEVDLIQTWEMGANSHLSRLDDPLLLLSLCCSAAEVPHHAAFSERRSPAGLFFFNDVGGVHSPAQVL